MIDWVNEKCKVWGPTHSAILFGKRQGAWPRRSVLGRIKEEWAGASHASKPVQLFPEVYIGEALHVQRAIREPFPMDYDLYSALVVHYCISKVDTEISVLPEAQLAYLVDARISRTEYFRYLDRAHHFLSARMQSVGTPPVRVGTNLQKMW